MPAREEYTGKFVMQNFRGTLFKNDRKEKETHPDYTGSAVVDDIDYWMSGWIKENRDGSKRLSISFTAKDKGLQPRSEANKRANGIKTEFDDDIPF
jgi:hypothetical protein